MAQNKEQIVARGAKYRAEHRESLAVKNNKYRAEHLEEVAARKSKYNAQHREEIAARDAEYYAKHREERRAYAVRYRAEHSEELAARAAGRRAEHREEIAARDAKRYVENRDLLLTQHARYRAEHRDAIRAAQAAAYQLKKEQKNIMKKSKLSIEIAQSEMVSVMGHLKTASSFREVDAIQGDISIRDALRRTSTASTVVAEHAVDARQQAEAIRRVAKLRLAALLAPMTPVEVCQTAEREGVTSKIEAQQLAAVGTLPASTIAAAELAVHKYRRQSKVQPKDYSLLVPLKPPQRKQALAKLADVPTMREAVAAVCPTFTPKAPVIEAKPSEIVPSSVRKYQELTLGLVAESLKLRGLVEALVKSPFSAAAVDRAFEQQNKVEEAVRLLRKASVLCSDRA